MAQAGGAKPCPEAAALRASGRNDLSVVHAVAHGGFGRACLYDLDKGMVPHAHREGHLLFHLGGASGELVVDGDVVPLTAMQGVAVNPWQPHLCRTVARGDHVLMLVLYIRPQWFGKITGRADADLQFGHADVKVTDQIRRLVQELGFLLAEQCGDSGDFEQCLAELVLAAHGQTWAHARGGEQMPWEQPRASDFRIRRALRLLDGSVGESIDLAAVSRASGLSRPHFFKLFREQTGVPPAIYLNALRIERAIDRLAAGDENVTEIGLELGFATPASFSRFFAANSVVPPSAYRRSLRALQLH